MFIWVTLTEKFKGKIKERCPHMFQTKEERHKKVEFPKIRMNEEIEILKLELDLQIYTK